MASYDSGLTPEQASGEAKAVTEGLLGRPSQLSDCHRTTTAGATMLASMRRPYTWMGSGTLNSGGIVGSVECRTTPRVNTKVSGRCNENNLHRYFYY